mmetsp:Transcript_11835/g.37588  ORF Transcript_11835/g.37588 Transcript_11835/m.37588 type:complete len:216 (+) Transcript_11835:188-835(+)
MRSSDASSATYKTRMFFEDRRRTRCSTASRAAKDLPSPRKMSTPSLDECAVSPPNKVSDSSTSSSAPSRSVDSLSKVSEGITVCGDHMRSDSGLRIRAVSPKAKTPRRAESSSATARDTPTSAVIASSAASPPILRLLSTASTTSRSRSSGRRRRSQMASRRPPVATNGISFLSANRLPDRKKPDSLAASCGARMARSVCSRRRESDADAATSRP